MIQTLSKGPKERRRVGRPPKQPEFSAEQHQILLQLRDHAAKPYLRERAAALLKLAAGDSAPTVARSGLLRPHKPKTLRRWLQRFQQEGAAGLTIRPGRGRKPAFSP